MEFTSMIHLKESELAQRRKTSQTRNVTGFPISILSFDDQVNAITQWAKARLSRVVCVSNVHMLMEGHWHHEFAQVLLNADLLTPDGMPLVWMTSLLHQKPQERVAGLELMRALCQQAQTEGIGLFLFGSKPEMLNEVTNKLLEEFPHLQVKGAISPPFRPLSDEENESIAREINSSGAGLVFVSLGCPKQEHWMHTHKEKIKATMVGLGGAFPVYIGDKQWAPKWVRELGLEWCYRLAQEPKRLWKRYASTIPPFLWLAFKQVVKVRLGLNPDESLRQQWARHS